MSFFNHITLPGLLISTGIAIKKFITNEKTSNEAIAGVAYDTTKNVVISVGKEIVKGAVGPVGNFTNVAIGIGVNTAVTTAEGVINKDNDLSKNILKAGICTLNAALLGPICSIPVNLVTNKAIDLGVEAKRVGFNTAYNNFKLHNDYLDLRYIKNFGGPLKEEVISSEDLGMSFINLSAPAA